MESETIVSVAPILEGKTRKYGTREEVFRGVATKTHGGLGKDDLFERGGRYVSKRASEAVKKRGPPFTNKAVAADVAVIPESPPLAEPVKVKVQKIEKAISKMSIEDEPVQVKPKGRKRAAKKTEA